MNLGDAMKRAMVLDYNLQTQLYPYMSKLKPRPSIYIPDFIAANQKERADNLLTGTLEDVVNQIRADIQDFKRKKNLDKVTQFLVKLIFYYYYKYNYLLLEMIIAIHQCQLYFQSFLFL